MRMIVERAARYPDGLIHQVGETVEMPTAQARNWSKRGYVKAAPEDSDLGGSKATTDADTTLVPAPPAPPPAGDPAVVLVSTPAAPAAAPPAGADASAPATTNKRPAAAAARGGRT